MTRGDQPGRATRARRSRFPRVSLLHRGYSRRQVDSLLRAVEAALSGTGPRMTAQQVRQAGFYLTRRGYDVAAVDAALDDLEDRLLDASVAGARQTAGSYVVYEVAALVRQFSAPPGARFPRVSWWRSGHCVDEVDALVESVRNALPDQTSVGVDELRSATFGRQRGGYDRAAVDQMLDRLIELLLTRRVVDVAARAATTPAQVDLSSIERSPKVADAP